MNNLSRNSRQIDNRAIIAKLKLPDIRKRKSFKMY